MWSKIPFRIVWVGMLLAAVFLFVLTASYFSFCTDCNFLLRKQDLLDNGFWMAAFYVHITGGMLALIIGPFQFVARIRTQFVRLHRSIGKVYLGAILFVAGPSGLFMAFYAEGGWVGISGFTMMATLWVVTTWMAYETIKRRDIKGHRAWMTRSFALTFAAVVLRAWVFGGTQFLGLEREFVEASSAWVSWLPNLLVAEILIKYFPKNL